MLGMFLAFTGIFTLVAWFSILLRHLSVSEKKFLTKSLKHIIIYLLIAGIITTAIVLLF